MHNYFVHVRKALKMKKNTVIRDKDRTIKKATNVTRQLLNLTLLPRPPSVKTNISIKEVSPFSTTSSGKSKRKRNNKILHKSSCVVLYLFSKFGKGAEWIKYIGCCQSEYAKFSKTCLKNIHGRNVTR